MIMLKILDDIVFSLCILKIMMMVIKYWSGGEMHVKNVAVVHQRMVSLETKNIWMIGFPDFLEDRPMVLAIAGGGYRLQLGEKSSLDLLLTARAVLDHPAIWDEEERHYIETQNVRRNDAVHYALCLSLGLNF